jgi:hypothetical protein
MLWSPWYGGKGEVVDHRDSLFGLLLSLNSTPVRCHGKMSLIILSLTGQNVPGSWCPFVTFWFGHYEPCTVDCVYDTVQESFMNARGNSSFHVVVNQTYTKTTSTTWINHLGVVPQDSTYYWMRNKEHLHIHCPVAAGFRLGCSRMYTILVHPSWKLQVDWIYSGLAEGGGGCPWWSGTGFSSTRSSQGGAP